MRLSNGCVMELRCLHCLFVWQSLARLALCPAPSLSYCGAASWFVGSVGRFLVVVGVACDGGFCRRRACSMARSRVSSGAFGCSLFGSLCGCVGRVCKLGSTLCIMLPLVALLIKHRALGLISKKGRRGLNIHMNAHMRRKRKHVILVT
jgi:hypothetical protein